MKKLFILLAVGMILLLGSGVFAASSNFSDSQLPEKLDNLVKNIADKKGIETPADTKVRKLDFNDLPENVKFDSVDDTNLGVYELDSGDGKPVYVLTLSEDTFNQLEESKDYKRMLLNFGHDGSMSQPGFLETATGVEGSTEKGYVMIRDGSITGLSTNLEVVNGIGSEQLEVVIYKNGIPSGFGNNIDLMKGAQNDYDVQSEGTITFEAGDVISVYVKAPSDVNWKDVTTLLEITTSE